jgi:hypothetical protein
MTQHDSTIQLQHPVPGKRAPRIDRRRYDMVAAALLRLIPADDEGVPFAGLADRVAESLAPAELALLGSSGWYTTAVKLDLESRGLIERVPRSRPQRLRRRSDDS